MKKVGILTYHNAINFGATIQAWAMAQAMRNLDCDARIINYLSPGRRKKSQRSGFKRWIPSLGAIRMRRFLKNSLPLTTLLESQQSVEKHVKDEQYDALVCGSDQIWMPDRHLGFDPVYYLDVVNETTTPRRISYAPSCGSMTSYGPHADEARRLFERFDSISVRDQRSADILKDLGVTDVTLVVDPTLLVDFTQLIGEPPDTRPYLAVAGNMNAEAAQLIRQIADRLKLVVYSVGARCVTADRQKPFVSPAQWVNYLAHAKFVVTGLFHGAACAISLRKPFVALDAAGRGFKLPELLGRFELNKQFVARDATGQYIVNDELLRMNYNQVETVIQREVDASRRYLREALND